MKIKVRSVISFIMAFMLMLLISVTILSSFIKFVFIKPEFYLDILHNQNTEKEIYNEINGNLEYALVSSNLPKEIAEGIITEEEVKDEYDSYFNILITYLNTGSNNITGVNTEIYLKRFDDKLNKYFVDNKVVIDDKLNKDVADLRSSLGQIIKNGVEVVESETLSKSSLLSRTASITSRFDTGLYYLLYIGIIILAAVILLLWYNNIYKGIRWLSSSFIAVGLIFTIVFLAGLLSKFYNNVIIYTPYLKQFISEVVKEDVRWLFINGIIILCAGIIIYMAGICTRNKLKRVRS